MQRRSDRRPGAPERRPIAVIWDKRLRRPTAFVWRRRRYRVERVVHTWVVETGWWDDSIRVSRRYCRVRADGRLFEIYCDRLTGSWFLDKALG
jgi:riboflavin biosynthesis pyrimidine reductase